MALSDRDFGLLQTSIDALMERIAELRLDVSIERDFFALTDFLKSTGSPVINPTFDPNVYPVPSDSFWLRIRDEDGTIVATHAETLFHSPNFLDLVASRKLWHPAGIPLPEGEVEPEIHQPPILIGGKVAYGGSMWINPSHRKLGLSVYLPYLSRALFMRNYETDFHTGICLNSLGLSNVPRLGYGFTNVEPCLTGWFAPSGKHATAYLCYMGQRDCIEQFYRLPEHPQFPVRLPRAAERLTLVKA
jgi:hypothetical protein